MHSRSLTQTDPFTDSALTDRVARFAGDKMAAIQGKSGAAADTRGHYSRYLNMAAIVVCLLALPAR